MALPDHLFLSDCEGSLHDTRQPDWAARPLRSNYSRAHSTVETLADVKATLRHGGHVWPGGYPLHAVTADGACLCFKCCREQFRELASAFIVPCPGDGWRVVAFEVNWEDSELRCEHCGDQIESAYGD